jgi:IS605 OrfB family transposase
LASLSTGEQLGKDIKQNIERVKRCKQGSNGKLRARRALKQRIDEVAKEVIKKDIDLVVVESLKNLGKNSKLKRLLSKNIRRSIGTWNWKYWLGRLEQRCEDNRVSFRSVSPYYTSQTCSCCGHVDRRNRDGEVFQCQKCGHADNADINASRNILSRFLTGKYGTCYKPENIQKLPTSGFL